VAQERRQYSREFKLMALSRMEEAGNVEALAEELGVRREMLYVWRFMVTLYSIPKQPRDHQGLRCGGGVRREQLGVE
jgi:Transposase